MSSRGDRREPIFDDDEDRAELLEVFAHGLERFDTACFAYCLMGNHYHFVAQTPQGNLSRFMRHVNGVCTQAYNGRQGKVGHLSRGRFKAVLVDEVAGVSGTGQPVASSWRPATNSSEASGPGQG